MCMVNFFYYFPSGVVKQVLSKLPGPQVHNKK
jgi:hypothetical protein